MPAGRFHIIIDILDITSEERLNHKQGLHQFLLKLPGLIGMSVLDGPLVTNGIPENPGLSGFVLIDFSHISIHTFTEYNQALVDIFSCKPFDQNKAKEAVLDYFQVSKPSASILQVSWK